ncbi:MAG: hypothetical protein F6K47_10470 [Symploca sp. SIO2E6]|nr:hypothetical protein [Symploca sp. SIO2E6]
MEQQDYRYKVGGSLSIKDRSYVERKADAELLAALQQGEYCYVFNCRQMGKSSLRVRTRYQLQQAGMSCASIDLSGETPKDLGQWYRGVINELLKGFNLQSKLNLKVWLQEQQELSPSQQLRLFIEDVLLVHCSGEKVFIFVDEIDKVLSSQFLLDDFFSLIRFFYNQRAENPAYERLGFALFGVATPSDLIQNKTQTSFNIGRSIELTGFKESGVQPLEEGLREKTDDPKAVLRRILYWTGGQPFLTQSICSLVANIESPIPAGREAEIVEQLVRSQVIENWQSQDQQSHLKTIYDRIFRNEQSAGMLLGLYQRILNQGQVLSDNSDEQIELRLSGLVVGKNGELKVYNPIYKEVFNLPWVKNALAQLRPYAEQMESWLTSGCDESLLLRGKALEKAQAWADGKDLSHDDYRYLTASVAAYSRNAVEEAERKAVSDVAQRLVGVSNPLAVLGQVRSWTGGQPILTDKLVQFVLNSQSHPIKEGNEAKWVEELVQFMINNWETHVVAEPLRKIRDYLLTDNPRGYQILETYRQILHRKGVASDESPEQLELLNIGLVVKQQGQLKVSNRIYEKVFNLSWVNEILANLQPYAKKLNAWLNSNYQDKSQLLFGQELGEALNWANNRVLQEEEQRFLEDSKSIDELLQAHLKYTQKSIKAPINLYLSSYWIVTALLVALGILLGFVIGSNSNKNPDSTPPSTPAKLDVEEQVNEETEWKVWYSPWDNDKYDKPPENIRDSFNTQLENISDETNYSFNPTAILNLGPNERIEKEVKFHGIQTERGNWENEPPNKNPNLQPDYFLTRGQTKSQFKRNALYQFEMDGDDGYQLWALLDQTSKERWIAISPYGEWQSGSQEIFFNEFPRNGNYYIVFFHYEKDGDAAFNINWKEINEKAVVNSKSNQEGLYLKKRPSREDNDNIVELLQRGSSLLIINELDGDSYNTMGNAKSNNWYKVLVKNDQQGYVTGFVPAFYVDIIQQAE